MGPWCRTTLTSGAMVPDNANLRELEHLLEDAAERLDAGDATGALDCADRGSKLTRRVEAEDAVVELAIIAARALSMLDRPREALARLDDALERCSDDLDLLVERGSALYELCRFEDARHQLLEVLRRDPEDPLAHHTLGLIAERSGNAAEAGRRFATAHRGSPEEFPESVVLSADEFDRAVEDALTSLPQQIRDYLSNVAIAVEDVPDAEDLLASEPPLSPSILGIFRGSPLGDKASMDPWSHFPSSIVLYQKNLERFARDHAELVDEIEITLIHEVGHFLGLDEEELWERGLE
jgi:predicted Zn-dependent protease with MMP-like domain